jgi:acetyl esterase
MAPGATLDPEIRAVVDRMAALQEASGLAAHQVPIGQARAGYESDTEYLSGPPEDVAEVRDLDAGGVPVRLYRPLGAEGDDLPLVVYLHGGGWVIGSLGSSDPVCRALANRSGALVASVDYRLAPEHPYPAAVEDSLAAFDSLRAELRPPRIAVAGDSAGGTLAAVVARNRRAEVDLQLLVYPVTDARRETTSYATYAEGFGLTALSMRRYWELYADGADLSNPDLSPLEAPDLAGLPPAYVILAEHDVLHDEGEAYARALEAAGVPVTLRRREGTVHGFWRWLARCGVSRSVLDEAGAALRESLRV